MTQSPVQPVVPVCYRHPKRETYVRCSRCNRPICPDCMKDASVGFQCPDCVSEGRRAQRPVRTALGGRADGHRGQVTITLIAINVVMFVLSVISAGGGLALASGLRGEITPLLRWGGVEGLCLGSTGQVVACGVADGEYYRLITAMFLHFGPLHVGLNMWALWIVGRLLESALGRWRFLALYLLAGVGGNVAAYLFSPGALSAGASTAVFGLFAALFIVLRRLGRDTSGVIPILVINLIFTFTVAGVSIPGHVGGLIFGALVATGLAYAPRQHRNAVQFTVIGATAVLLAALTVAQTVSLTAIG